MGRSDAVSPLGPLLLIVMGLSVFSSVLQSKRLQVGDCCTTLCCGVGWRGMAWGGVGCRGGLWCGTGR